MIVEGIALTCYNQTDNYKGGFHMGKYILASTSPRRHELIGLTGYTFETAGLNVDETMNTSLEIEARIIDVARRKVEAVAKKYLMEDTILACDTAVVYDDIVLGKPESKDEAGQMMRALAGRSHRVITGCVLKKGNTIKEFYEDAEVTFSKIQENEIETYLETEEFYGKAGGYAVQGYAARFVTRLNGDYYSVMGLPVSRVYRELLFQRM
jgi:septum formation protein